MDLATLSEVIWQYAAMGRPQATQQGIDKDDISQMVVMLLGKMMYAQYYDSRKQDESLEADYSFYDTLLSKQPFELSEPDHLGKRSIDLKSFKLFSLPKNKHIVNMIMVGDGCDNKTTGQVTQISPAEENFYVYDPNQSDFKFFRPSGKKIETWHIPTSVKKVIIESTFQTSDLDISEDIAYDIARGVLALVLGSPEYIGKQVDNPYNLPEKLLRKSLQQAQAEQQG